MPFQPDLTEFGSLCPNAPFPATMQGAWVDAGTGMDAMTIEGRTVTIGDRMPIYDLFVHEEDGQLTVLNALADTSDLDPDWAERTVYIFHLDDQGALSIVGFCDYWTLVRPEAIDPANVSPPISPYQPLAPDDHFPEPLQGHWRGAWHGQDVIIGPREVTIDGEQLEFLAAKLIRVIPSDFAPLWSLVLELHKEEVESRFGTKTVPMLNFMVFRSGEMQGKGPHLRDAMFSPLKDNRRA